MIRIRGRRRVTPEISQASASDVAFLLLIFFLSATAFTVEVGIPVVLPAWKAAPAQVARRDVLIARVRASGEWLLDGRAVDPWLAADAVRARIAADPKLVLRLETDPEAPYGAMVGFLDEIRKAGVTRLDFRMASSEEAPR
ncbi:MAG: ExbD/TolR family protein [Candidatus Eisenbacteria bacterium]